MPGQVPVATRQFSDYNPQPDLTETAVQDAIPTESYGNSGLNIQIVRADYVKCCQGRTRWSWLRELMASLLKTLRRW